ncbi:tetratricopeptide repeat protein [uncultured Intestinimonas sp.]|uniref:tetratricopeptide repeat protein n=1 Tax=uncultured Intestinimonas sp. TaxID=1689265 RepID=UPI0025D70FE1|nr:tetratricopeptide repeat protein [uncultured Intestinimonas sp.]
MIQKLGGVLLAVVLLLTACSGQGTGSWQEQYDLGVRYLSEGNYEEAILAFTAAIEIDPSRAEAYAGRGGAYIASGETEENLATALADYEADDALETLREAVEHTDDPAVAEKLAEMEGGTFTDSAGLRRRVNHYDGVGELSSYSLYEYDTEGHILQESSYDPSGALIQYVLHEWSNGKHSKVSWYWPDGTLDIYNTYEYDSNGAILVERHYTGDGELNGYTIYERNEEGFTIRNDFYDADGNLHSYSTFEYDINGNQTRYTYHNADGTIHSYGVFEYDDSGNLVKINNYDASGNLTGSTTYS